MHSKQWSNFVHRQSHNGLMRVRHFSFSILLLLFAILPSVIQAQGPDEDYYSRNQDHFAITDGLYQSIDDFINGKPIGNAIYSVTSVGNGGKKVHMNNDAGVYQAVLLVYDGIVYAGTPMSKRQRFMPFKGSASDRYRYLVTSPTRLANKGEIIIKYDYVIFDNVYKDIKALSPEKVGAFFADYPDQYVRWQFARHRDMRLFDSLMEDINASLSGELGSK